MVEEGGKEFCASTIFVPTKQDSLASLGNVPAPVRSE